MATEVRKSSHLDICLKGGVEFGKGNGLDDYELPHNALPELDRDSVGLKTQFLGKPFSAPIFIEAMTGGHKSAMRINRNLAEAAQRLGLGMGVGSQRAGIENPSLAKTYTVRDAAPDIFLLGNIGAVQLREAGPSIAEKAVDMIGADGVAVHLNASQEAIQPGGDTGFSGVLDAIKELCDSVKFPVVVKEVGSGISGEIARQLEKAGVSAIDVAGAGGTSWTKVEYARNPAAPEGFGEWGIKTAECLRQCSGIKVPLIASGGMRTGLDAAKGIAMGASLAGYALPLLKPASESADSVVSKLTSIIEGLRTAMFLAGAKDVDALSGTRLIQSAQGH